MRVELVLGASACTRMDHGPVCNTIHAQLKACDAYTDTHPHRVTGEVVTVYLCVLKVMSPQRSDLVLTANVPHREVDVLVLHGLNIEPCTPDMEHCDTCSGQLYLHTSSG